MQHRAFRVASRLNKRLPALPYKPARQVNLACTANMTKRQICLGFACLLLGSSGAGCHIMHAHHCCVATAQGFSDDWYAPQFVQFTNFTKRLVLCSSNGSMARSDQLTPPVLLLHEMPGLTRQCLILATNLAAQGFKVYVPLMFGVPDVHTRYAGAWNDLHLMVFGSGWHVYRKSQTPRIVNDLRDLIKEIERVNRTNSIGVIGMCLSGSLPLALLSERSVRAVVLSQPAIPFLRSSQEEAALGLSPEDLFVATNRVAFEKIPIMALRFETDLICQKRRFDTLKYELGTNFVDLTIPLKEYNADMLKDGHPHAVLTQWYCGVTNSATRSRFEKVVEYLHDRLDQKQRNP
jgi:dienelactone hydrolase